MFSKHFKIIFLSLVLTMALTASLAAWDLANPRAIAMGGAYSALCRGYEVSRYNPANLGLATDHKFTLNLASAGVGIKNNSFSLKDYNDYTGQFLTDTDKENILGKIPAEGLNLSILTEAGSMNFSVWRLAFNFSGLGASKFNIDKDPFELLLFGNAVKSELDFKDTQGEAVAVGDGSVSYGHPLMAWKSGELAIGATAHYLYGIAYEKIVEAEGNVATTSDGFTGAGIMKLRSALGGNGCAFDIGTSIRFQKNWVFSASWHNLYSKINWNKDTEETVYTFDMQPLDLDDLSDGDTADSLVESTDTTYDISSFSSTMPSAIRLGLARAYKKLTWSVEWEQGISDGASQAVTPRLSGGVEYKLIKQIPLRAGTSFGGDRGTILSTGFGVYLGPVHLDFAFANNGSFNPATTRGALLAFGMGLVF